MDCPTREMFPSEHFGSKVTYLVGEEEEEEEVEAAPASEQVLDQPSRVVEVVEEAVEAAVRASAPA